MLSDIRGYDGNEKKDIVRNGDPGKSSTSKEAFIPFGTKKAGNDKLSGAVNQDGQDSSTNVKRAPKRSVPGEDQKLIPKKVEEKVVQEKIIRNESPKRREATLLYFVPIKGLPNVARVQLLLSNISERSLQFKLKSEPGPNISALPSSKGFIDAHGSAKCILTWHREAHLKNWSDAEQPKMLLVLDFLRDKTENEKRTLTRLIGRVLSDQTCDSHRPPVEQLMLDAVTDEYVRLMSREEVHTVRGDSGGKGNKARTKAAADGIADWLNQQSNETLFALLLLIIFFYFLGMLNSSSRKGHDD